jgi:hypothetical protein
VRSRLHRLWLGRDPATRGCWLAAAALLLSGALVYWLSPGTVLFERWFGLPAPERLFARPYWLDAFTGATRNWWPDLAWAFFAGLVVRDLAWAATTRVPGPLVLLAAVSWELGQGLQSLPGVFTWPDFSVSMAAGICAVLCGAPVLATTTGANR